MSKESVTIKFGECTLVCEGTYSPPIPGRFYMRNGDPGYPPEPSEFEIDRVLFESEPDEYGITDTVDISTVFEAFDNHLEEIKQRLGKKFEVKPYDYKILDSVGNDIWCTLSDLCCEILDNQ